MIDLLMATAPEKTAILACRDQCTFENVGTAEVYNQPDHQYSREDLSILDMPSARAVLFLDISYRPGLIIYAAKLLQQRKKPVEATTLLTEVEELLERERKGLDLPPLETPPPSSQPSCSMLEHGRKGLSPPPLEPLPPPSSHGMFQRERKWLDQPPLEPPQPQPPHILLEHGRKGLDQPRLEPPLPPPVDNDSDMYDTDSDDDPTERFTAHDCNCQEYSFQPTQESAGSRTMKQRLKMLRLENERLKRKQHCQKCWPKTASFTHQPCDYNTYCPAHGRLRRKCRSQAAPTAFLPCSHHAHFCECGGHLQKCMSHSASKDLLPCCDFAHCYKCGEQCQEGQSQAAGVAFLPCGHLACSD